MILRKNLNDLQSIRSNAKKSMRPIKVSQCSIDIVRDLLKTWPDDLIKPTKVYPSFHFSSDLNLEILYGAKMYYNLLISPKGIVKEFALRTHNIYSLGTVDDSTEHNEVLKDEPLVFDQNGQYCLPNNIVEQLPRRG